ncbi:MAG: tetratricopeptide repeat protein, partial [Candidatus Thermoplasmatota archaeon]|nr:tetratricopeptide repeat protein [Candidatus Thermoplasmatota archaeon]
PSSIQYRDGDKYGEESLLGISDALSKITGITVHPSDVVEWMVRHDVLDMGDFSSKIGQKTETSFIQSIAQSPSVGMFVGREAEEKKMIDALALDRPKTIILLGMPGIGKTYLAARVLNSLSGQRDLFWHRIRRWDTIETLAEDFGNFFAKAGKHSVQRVLEDGGLTPSKLFSEVLSDMDGLNPVFFFDDAHNSSKDIHALWELFVESNKRGKKFGMVFTSREELGFHDRLDEGPGGNVEKIVLSGLDRKSAELLFAEGLPDSVYDSTGGHPLFLELARRTGQPASQGEKSDYVAHNVLSRLGESERLIMERMSVFSSPVKPEAVLVGGDAEALARLKETGLVAQNSEGKIYLHEILASSIYEMVPLENKKEFHKKAGQYLTSYMGTEGRGLSEAVMHLEKGGEHEKAAELIVEGWQSIETNRELVEEILSLLDLKQIPDVLLPELLLVSGRLYWKIGNRGEAMGCCNQILSLNTATEEQKARASGLMGLMLKEEKRWKDSIESYKASLERYESRKDFAGMGAIRLELGSVYGRKGEYERAQEEYSLAEEIFGKIGDIRGRAAAWHNLGALALEMSRYKKARNALKKALHLARKGGDMGAVSLTMEQQGMLALAGANYQESLGNILEALGLLETEGDWNGMLDMSIRGARAFLANYCYEEALIIAKKGLKMKKQGGFLSFQKKDMVWLEHRGKLHGLAANALREMGDLEGCKVHREAALENFEEIGSEENAGRENMERAVDLEQEGRGMDALEAIGKAKKMLSDGMGHWAALYVEAKMLERMGRYSDSLKALHSLQKQLDITADAMVK